MSPRIWIMCGGLIGALAIVAGVIAAHSLEEWLAATGKADTFETAVRYQMYHALALVMIGLVRFHRPCGWATVAGWSFLAGVILFCGGLYAYIATFAFPFAGENVPGKYIVMIVPGGGMLFIFGWTAVLMTGRELAPPSTSGA